ncbi:MAG TPA: dTMP kinase [Gemmatimonadaceae bacterium]|nr:dTMP kinase [Gemmatimonadaceae bacterium]
MPLIVLEGPEGAGKTTQLRLLADWLGEREVEVIAVREPGGTPVGDQIRRVLLDPASDIVPRAEALLFMASRAQLVQREILPALATNHVILLDRFFLSTYAYQVAGRGLPQEEIVAANRLATATLRPDLTLLLSLPVEEGLRRAGARGPSDRMEQAAVAFHERVAGAFAEFATREWQAAHPEAGPVTTVDGRGAEDEVFRRVLATLAHRWPGTFAS